MLWSYSVFEPVSCVCEDSCRPYSVSGCVGQLVVSDMFIWSVSGVCVFSFVGLLVQL